MSRMTIYVLIGDVNQGSDTWRKLTLVRFHGCRKDIFRGVIADLSRCRPAIFVPGAKTGETSFYQFWTKKKHVFSTKNLIEKSSNSKYQGFLATLVPIPTPMCASRCSNNCENFLWLFVTWKHVSVSLMYSRIFIFASDDVDENVQNVRFQFVNQNLLKNIFHFLF